MYITIDTSHWNNVAQVLFFNWSENNDFYEYKNYRSTSKYQFVDNYFENNRDNLMKRLTL